MSGIAGKKSSTLRKGQVAESNVLATGVKNLKFWHEAAEGDTSIPFGALNLPADIATAGLTNPSAQDILSANLSFFKENVEVRSSLNGDLMIGLTFLVKNSQITFVNGYEAVEGEVFEVRYENKAVTGNLVVDARPLTATGTLAAGTQEFVVGETFKTNTNPLTQLGDVLVFLDGEIQYRNVGNSTASVTADGNYEEVHAGGGFGTVIRFNDTFVEDKAVIVISRNLIAERPNVSMMQLIENLGGQLDRLVEVVAQDAGIDPSEFQTAPNQIDLRAFGDQVYANRQAIEANTALIDTKQDKFTIPWQIKILNSNFATDNTDIADLIFNNLEEGKTYRIGGSIEANYANSTVNVEFRDEANGGGNPYGVVKFQNKDTGSQTVESKSPNIIFTASSDTLYVHYDHTLGTNGSLSGGQGRARTFIILEELPNHVETGKWS